ncbi:PREDICTED: uncharacterized protein LOC108523128 isoform X2 [Rhinopithecus bieti]|uniref:uncharacterized protein LOC108523128 isoform X2 n=1 Tax=Rhinopithecus bieti TaxID=61621 RepID=UPI00083C30EB|nr:PREDICTED: uncharacterized protein LOC108523128 isoform X2 [Rhinopithecus bieti]
MRRFGSLRSNKKHKDQNRSTERRQSEPHGLFDVMVGATAATLDLRVTAKKRRHMPREETSFCNDTMTYSKTCFL